MKKFLFFFLLVCILSYVNVVAVLIGLIVGTLQSIFIFILYAKEEGFIDALKKLGCNLFHVENKVR